MAVIAVVTWGSAYPWIIAVFRTVQYSIHWTSTFALLRSVNRSIPDVYLMWANNGSNVPILGCSRTSHAETVLNTFSAASTQN
jgi:hypothetical protein